MSAAERSRELFESGWCCSESAVQAIAEHYGIESDLVPAVATGLCGGLAYMGGPCGALTGAILGVGLVAGRRAPTGDKTRPYAIVQELIAQFEARYGATTCLALTGVDLGTPEGHTAYHAAGQKPLCADYVAEATRLALALLDGEAG